jgi:aromatic ring hydroxylase
MEKMKIKTKEDYVKSLQEQKVLIYYNGQRIWTAPPTLRLYRT